MEDSLSPHEWLHSDGSGAVIRIRSVDYGDSFAGEVIVNGKRVHVRAPTVEAVKKALKGLMNG